MEIRIEDDEQAAISESIAHWDRMIEFMIDYYQDYHIPDLDEMVNQIKEGWSAYWCALCRLHDDKCHNCIIAKEDIRCTSCLSKWAVVNRAPYAKKWIAAAIHLRNFLAELIDEPVKEREDYYNEADKEKTF